MTVWQRVTHSVEQEADVALDHLNHPVDVHHGLLIPAAEVGPHLRLQVLQLNHGIKHIVEIKNKNHHRFGFFLVSSFTSGVCRLLWRPWTYLSSSNRNVCQVKEQTTLAN